MLTVHHGTETNLEAEALYQHSWPWLLFDLRDSGFMMDAPVFTIVPTVQHYDWGKIGITSKVAQLAFTTPNFTLEPSKPYAEVWFTTSESIHPSSNIRVLQLWMGTHPTSPSLVCSSDSNIQLSAYLAAHPHLLGTSVLNHFAISDGNIPFLFKVLSIQKALSIQSHPDKHTAEQLHAQQPHIYKGLHTCPFWLLVPCQTNESMCRRKPQT